MRHCSGHVAVQHEEKVPQLLEQSNQCAMTILMSASSNPQKARRNTQVSSSHASQEEGGGVNISISVTKCNCPKPTKV